MANPTLGKTLREMRKHYGMTQQQLADEAGTSRNIISIIENEKGNPKLQTIIDLFYAMGHVLEIQMRPKAK